MINFGEGSAKVLDFLSRVRLCSGAKWSCRAKTNFPGDNKVYSVSDSATNKASAVDAGCAFLSVFALNLFITSIQIRIKNDSHQEFRNIRILFSPLGTRGSQKRSINTFFTPETSS